MDETLEQSICKLTGAKEARRGEVLQQLWSGYGEIVRYGLIDADAPSVVVKQIALPEEMAHPRGWHTDTGHQRKLRSYEVESEWYRQYAARCGDSCRVARCFGVQGEGVVSAMVLQDLDADGFDQRLQHASAEALDATLRWLANFHATWLGESAGQLWPRGSYWHLATRPDELAVMDEGPLKTHALALDAALENAQFKTLIHGDAKIANFCYSADHRDLVAVDFQYVGSGVGVVDLAYFLGSCMSGRELAQHGDALFERYLQLLAQALGERGVLDAAGIEALIAEWRELYSVAWADFERFLQGWSPGHPKLNSYSSEMTAIVLRRFPNL